MPRNALLRGHAHAGDRVCLCPVGDRLAGLAADGVSTEGPAPETAYSLSRPVCHRQGPGRAQAKCRPLARLIAPSGHTERPDLGDCG